MNKVILIGRLTKDPEIRTTSNEKQFCSFSIAVDRPFKDASGNRQTDFISCVAWNQTAVFIQKYFKKGNRIGIVGSIQTREFDNQEGTKVRVTDVQVSEAEFVESTHGKKDDGQEPESEPVGKLPFEI